MRECSECGEMFELHSEAKRRAGGLISHCPSCATETAVKCVGVSAGDGKQAGVSIMKPKTDEDRQAFLSYWRSAVGMHCGKSCQLRTAPAMPRFDVEVVSAAAATNHKGKA